MADDDESAHSVTVRLIRSFEYRNIRNMVVHDVKLSTTVREFKELIKHNVQTMPAFVPYRKHVFDTLQLYSQPHGFKDPMSHVLDDAQTLKEAGIQNETELSFFNFADYLAFLKSPVEKWT